MTPVGNIVEDVLIARNSTIEFGSRSLVWV